MKFKMAAAAVKFVWLETIRNARKTSLVQDGRRKVHYTFPDGAEMVEEYDVSSGELLVRKWKSKSGLGKEGKWEFEIGEDMRPVNLDLENITESRGNPIFTRKDSTKAFQWRIRNLPYPLNVYSVTVNEDENSITVRTSNKKYFKRLNIPDMDRAKLKLEQSAISAAHANNTLIITVLREKKHFLNKLDGKYMMCAYQKPALILEQEKLIRQELAKMKSSRDGDVECKPS